MAAINASAFQPVPTELDEVDRLLEEIAEFRASHARPRLADAVELAKRLEQSAAEKLHRTVVGQSNPELAGFIERLASDDHKHLELLEELEREFVKRAS